MDNPTETPEDVDRLLAQARKALQDFEDGVDRKRLLLRLRTASPAHPVLLARFLFGALGVLCVVAAIVVMAITQVNNDLARELAKFEMVIPYVPEEVPALPALLGTLALCMGFAWVMATFAALSLGRDATMLPWEQKQHQKLVNEVTRLTTQKAVMERIRSTPAGARPRIATPVPVSARRASPGGSSALARGGFVRTPAGAPGYAAPPGPKTTPGGTLTYSPIATPAPAVGSPLQTPFGAPAPGGFGPRGAGLGARSGAASAPPASTTAQGTGAGGFAPVSVEPSGYSAPVTPAATAPPPGYEPTNGSGGHGWGAGPDDVELPDEPPPPENGGVRLGKGGGVRLGAARQPAQRPPELDDLSDLVEVAGGEDTGPTEEEPTDGPATPSAPSTGGGILGRARAGAVHLRSTPYGSAGRVRPPPSAAPARSGTTNPPRGGAPSAPPRGATNPSRVPASDPAPQAPAQRATRGGTPLGAAPKAGVPVSKSAPRLAPPIGFPGTPERADRHDDRASAKLPGGMFGTPAPITRNSRPPVAVALRDAAAANEVVEDEVSVMEEEEVEADSPTVSAGTRTDAVVRELPPFGPIEDEWLQDALRKAEALLRSFPMQAYLEFNQEPNLPFTLVITRATPAMAVRAMVNFVEFLAGIATPVRARIELVNVNHLDRSFHKNVEAALEPYFGGNVEVEPNPGRVDIRFTDPDPQWGAYPTLPILEE